MTKISGRVLVVDDHENWRQVLRMLLELERCEVLETTNFQEAQALLVSQDFDLVVLEVRLVNKEIFNFDGLKLLRFIKGHSPVTKTIVLTGYAESIRGKTEADALMYKGSFDNQEFRKRVRELLANRSNS